MRIKSYPIATPPGQQFQYAVEDEKGSIVALTKKRKVAEALVNLMTKRDERP